VGIRSLPFLADHGFQDMVVLPGALSIQVASLLHEEIFKKPTMTLRNIRFQNPVILSEDIILKVKIRENSGKPVEYAFFEPRSGFVRSPEIIIRCSTRVSSMH
jgi:Polyketide synthase dehydratase